MTFECDNAVGVHPQSEAAALLGLRIVKIQSGVALRLPPHSKERS